MESSVLILAFVLVSLCEWLAVGWIFAVRNVGLNDLLT